jgi:hypothetical protein
MIDFMNTIETQNEKNRKSYNNIVEQWIATREKSDINNIVMDFSKKLRRAGKSWT